jgi:hypothetical protein
MEGYDVVTVDDQKIGKVVGESGDFLLVEQGALLKSKHAVPRELTHVDDSEQKVRVTVPKEIVDDSPKIEDDGFDERAVAEHYGLGPRSVALLGAAGGATRDRTGRGRTSPDPGRRRAERPPGVVARAARRPAGRNRRTGAGGALGALGRAEAAASQRREQVVAARLLVVPGERDPTHQVGVRLLEAGMVPERRGEPPDAALAADAGHLERLGLD